MTMNAMFSLYLSLIYVATIVFTTPNRFPGDMFGQHHIAIDQALMNENTVESDGFKISTTNDSTFSAILNAVEIMQANYFDLFGGTWPLASDWTAAVVGTQTSATLSVMSEFKAHFFETRTCDDGNTTTRAEAGRQLENLINQYFTQKISFYFGENAFGLRLQGYDDMLWVVLDWLESIKFINLHSELNHNFTTEVVGLEGVKLKPVGWYGRQFIPQFAHRAHIFYDLASQGWDTSLCGGGMIWSPYFAPYKNAITNQLFIAASIGMYLHFPGDDNSAPFVNRQKLSAAKPHDTKYLDAAIEAYRWLSTSNMTNDQGLYVDGFHIQGWRGDRNGTRGSENCDLRDEMVFTYNQGVILSGLRGLWHATGENFYLDDGHELIRNVIAATGWHDRNTNRRWSWAGLGRNGVMEEACDSRGSCDQDSQTFKGIFFHHLSIFCSCLPKSRLDRSNGQMVSVQEDVTILHRRYCEEYAAWTRNNARAAYVTRDQHGIFGAWWGRPFHHEDYDGIEEDCCDIPNVEGTDYRNGGVPADLVWRLSDDPALEGDMANLEVDTTRSYREWRLDPNDRGRGRSLETQSGGLAVLRALWYTSDRKSI